MAKTKAKNTEDAYISQDRAGNNPHIYNPNNAEERKKIFENLEQQIRDNPDNPSPYYQQGILFLAEGNPAKAVECLDKSREKSAESEKKGTRSNFPQTNDLLNWLGRAYVGVKQFDNAIGAYEECIKTKPNSSDAYIQLATLYFNFQRGDDAIQVLEKAIERGIKDPAVYNLLGFIFIVINKPDDAAYTLEYAKKLNKKSSAISEPITNNLAAAYIKMKRTEDAIKLYDDEIKKTPKTLSYYANLAQIYGAAKRYDDARRVLEDLDKINTFPDNAKIIKAKLQELDGLKKSEKALQKEKTKPK